MVGGSIRAAAKAAMVGGYRSAAYMRRAVTPSSSSAADTRKASTVAVDDWVITDHEVFGPVPTHEEALAATVDLSDAFEMCVLSLCLHSFSLKLSVFMVAFSAFVISLPSTLIVKCSSHLFRSNYTTDVCNVPGHAELQIVVNYTSLIIS